MSNDEPDNLITLETRRRKACLHGGFIVDEDLDEVICGKCKEKINPYEVVRIMAKAESRLAWRYKELEKLNTKIEAKSKVKCRHCWKMTPVVR